MRLIKSILILLILYIGCSQVALSDQMDLGNYSITQPFIIYKPYILHTFSKELGNSSGTYFKLMGEAHTGIIILEGNGMISRTIPGFHDTWSSYLESNSQDVELGNAILLGGLEAAVGIISGKNLSEDKDLATKSTLKPFPGILMLSPATGTKGFAGVLSPTALIFIATEESDDTFHTILNQIQVVHRSEEGKSRLAAIASGL